MRTTITLEEGVFKELKEKAYRSGKSFKQVVNETLQDGLAAAERQPKRRRYRLEPSSMGGPRPDIDLDKALQLADALEDEAIAGKLEARK